MNRIVVVLALGVGGCKSLESVTVVGSAYVETERPDGKAVAKIEIRYTPAGHAPRTAPGSGARERQATPQEDAPPQPPTQPTKKRPSVSEDKSDSVKTNRERAVRPIPPLHKHAGNTMWEWLWPTSRASTVK